MRMEKENTNTAEQNLNYSVRREKRMGIPTWLKEHMERSAGLPLDNARTYYNADLPARSNAPTCVQENQVENDSGQERYSPHELGHVVQRKLEFVRTSAVHSDKAALNMGAVMEYQTDETGVGDMEPRQGTLPDHAVIQRATEMNFDNIDFFRGELLHNSIISAVNHYQRVTLRPEERANAARFGGGVICNHYVPYNWISNAIIQNYLINQTVDNAINGINFAIGMLNMVGGGFDDIPQVVFSKFDYEMIQEFDDAIANIANDPRNLFYSLYHTGDRGGRQIDIPLDANGQDLAAGTYIEQYGQTLLALNMA